VSWVVRTALKMAVRKVDLTAVSWVVRMALKMAARRTDLMVVN
jgi:hypothetical protein